MKLLPKLKIPNGIEESPFGDGYIAYVYTENDTFTGYIDQIEILSTETSGMTFTETDTFFSATGTLHISNEYLKNIEDVLQKIDELYIRKSKSIIYEIEQTDCLQSHNPTRRFNIKYIIDEGEPSLEYKTLSIKFKIKTNIKL